MRVHRNCCGLDVHKQTIATNVFTSSVAQAVMKVSQENFDLIGSALTPGFEDHLACSDAL
jgi:hypothetical protein